MGIEKVLLKISLEYHKQFFLDKMFDVTLMAFWLTTAVLILNMQV